MFNFVCQHFRRTELAHHYRGILERWKIHRK